MDRLFKQVTGLFCMLLINSIAFAQIPANGVVAHWTFTGNAVDSGAYAMNGNVNSATLSPGKLGAANTAYLFNGLNSFISIPYNSHMNMTSISLCTVIKPTGFYTNTCQGNYVLSRGKAGTNGNYLITFFDNPYNDCSQSDTNLFVYGPQAGPVQLTLSSWQTSNKIHTGNWYCLVMTYNGTTLKTYINGTLDLTLTGWAPIGTSSDSMCIGRSLWEGSPYPYNYTGLIDDIAIYNRVLSDSEVSNYCINAPKAGASVPDTTNSIGYHNAPTNTIKLYPNPNNGSFVIDGNIPSGLTNIEIHNMIGSILYRNSVNTENNSIHQNIDISALPQGMYLLKISGDHYSGNIRFIKQE